MTLRKKTIVLISVSVIVLITILFLITKTIVRNGFTIVQNDLKAGFSRVEHTDTKRNVRRVIDALHQTIENLSIKAVDWAQWDDTYAYVEDKNKAYEESNLAEDALSALKINMLLIVNTKADIVISRGFDLEKDSVVDVCPDLVKLLSPESILLPFADTSSFVQGLVQLPQKTLLYVARPIVQSSGDGPIRGAVIFGKFLDDQEIAHLASVTHVRLRVQRLDDPQIPDEFSHIRNILIDTATSVVNETSIDTITGYGLLQDIYMKPALIIAVDIKRDIHAQAAATEREIQQRADLTLLSLVISLIVFGLVVALVMLFLMEKSVLKRLALLSLQTSKIGKTNDFSARVSIAGTDEISQVSKSINTMLEALGESHQIIMVRDAEMKLLMNSVPVGLLSLTEDFVINPQYSKSTEALLKTTQLAGINYLQLLFPNQNDEKNRKKLFDFLDLLKQEIIPEKDMAGLNPFEIFQLNRNNQVFWSRIRYYLIQRKENQSNHILVVMEDITEEKKLAEQAEKSQRENLYLKAVAENPDLFRDFLIETKKILVEISDKTRQLVPDTSSVLLVNEIFRGVHTIKGISGSFGLTVVSSSASQLEEKLSNLRETGIVTSSEIEQTLKTLNELHTVFEHVVQNTKTFLGDELDIDGGYCLRISLQELKNHIEKIKYLNADELVKDRFATKLKHEMISILQSMQSIPARKGLSRSLRVVPGLIERMGKEVDFVFEGADILVDCEILSQLNTALIHMFRNALDHGIEHAHERTAKNKPTKGILKLSVSQNDHVLQVTLSDDGRGIDAQKIRQIALERAIITEDQSKTMSEKECIDLIFRPGFSTAEDITDVSGRGVGMDAVTDVVCSKLKGFVLVNTMIHKGTSIILNIPSKEIVSVL